MKEYQSIITDGNRVYINGTGNPYMAVAGMGDTLTGLIASLVGQGSSVWIVWSSNCWNVFKRAGWWWNFTIQKTTVINRHY
ncbi:MAG: hypothetical protein OHM56_04710 [Spiroplasma phoeniceum]|nr:MAG: hypothetical protein OHM56_04710 [Spiroplasma phoeniceum]